MQIRQSTRRLGIQSRIHDRLQRLHGLRVWLLSWEKDFVPAPRQTTP